MNKIIKFDEESNILTCERGVVLEEANTFLEKFNYEIPWDLGSKGSCLLGGNVST